jgi:hypothetical protein
MDTKTETKAETKTEPKAPTIKPADRLVYDCFRIEVNGADVVAFTDNGRLVLTRKSDCQIVPPGKGQRYEQLVCDRNKIVVQ